MQGLQDHSVRLGSRPLQSRFVRGVLSGAAFDQQVIAPAAISARSRWKIETAYALRPSSAIEMSAQGRSDERMNPACIWAESSVVPGPPNGMSEGIGQKRGSFG